MNNGWDVVKAIASDWRSAVAFVFVAGLSRSIYKGLAEKVIVGNAIEAAENGAATVIGFAPNRKGSTGGA